MALGFSFVPISIAAVAGVQASEQGLASGLFNTSQQIGGALGIAILSTVATTTAENHVEGGIAVPFALTDGFQAAFWVASGVAFAGVVGALTLIRRRDFEPAVEAAPALDLAA